MIENKGWLAGKDTVSSAVYDREDGTRVIYAVNTNWWSSGEKNAEAELYFGDMHYTIDIPGDRITRIMISGGLAAVTSDMVNEIRDPLPVLLGGQAGVFLKHL